MDKRKKASRPKTRRQIRCLSNFKKRHVGIHDEQSDGGKVVVEEGETPKPKITPEERNFIQENIDETKTRALFVEGMLTHSRKGEQSLEEIRDMAVENKESPEQTELWENAYEFLNENRDFFGLKGLKNERT